MSPIKCINSMFKSFFIWLVVRDMNPQKSLKVGHDSLSGKKCGNLKKHIHELKMFLLYKKAKLGL